MEREDLKEAIVRDLNADEYPFIIDVKGNTVIGRWKNEEIPILNVKENMLIYPKNISDV